MVCAVGVRRGAVSLLFAPVVAGLLAVGHGPSFVERTTASNGPVVLDRSGTLHILIWEGAQYNFVISQ